MEEVIAGLLSDQEVRTFGEVIVPVLDIFQGRIKDLDLCQPLLYSYLDVLLLFSHQKDIAKVRRHMGRFLVAVIVKDQIPTSLIYSKHITFQSGSQVLRVLSNFQVYVISVLKIFKTFAYFSN